jgi:hypothetical protein
MVIEETIMPSLLGTTVAANYGKMNAQQSYSTGTNYTNFGTRNVRFIKVVLSGSTKPDLTKGADGATGAYTDSLSFYSKAVRALQTVAEIYAVYAPDATSFALMIADDTVNDSDTNSNLPTGYGDVEETIRYDIEKNLSSWTTGNATVTISTMTWSGATLS